jgi:hypothetical protein
MIITWAAMVWLVAAMPGARQQDRTVPTVHVRIDQDGGLSPACLSETLDQMQEIWRAAGVRLTRGSYGEPPRNGAATVSLRILGTAVRKIDGATVLAWVSPTDAGRPAPILFVSLQGIRELLAEADFRGRPLKQRPQAIRDRLIAIAAGRAAAHELGHYLRGEGQHTAAGLMRGRYKTSDLIAESLAPFQVPMDDRGSVRREVARLAQRQAASRLVDPR